MMTEQTQRRGVIAFLALAFGIAWLLWCVPFVLGAKVASAPFRGAIFLGTFAPAIACFVVRRWVTREGFTDAGLRLDLRRWPYYAFALLVPLALALGITLVAPLLGAGHPDWARALTSFLPPAMHAPNGVATWLTVVTVLLAASVVFTPILWGEEFGWRSYLQLRLFPRRPLAAAVATGIIWGVWHYPLLLFGTELPQHPLVVLLIFPLGTVLYSVVFGWLRTRSAGIWAPSLAHSAFDNLRSPLLAALFAAQADKLVLAFISLAFTGVVAGVIAVVERRSAIRPASAIAPG